MRVCVALALLLSRLARIDIGGTKGKSLTSNVQQIHADFEATVATFKTVQYDIMDVGRKEFDDDFYEFRCKIKNLEVRTSHCFFPLAMCFTLHLAAAPPPRGVVADLWLVVRVCVCVRLGCGSVDLRQC